MKHFLTTALITAALLGSAHAQSGQPTTFKSKSGNLTLTFLGCVTGDNAQLAECSVRSTLTGQDSAGTDWSPSALSYYLDDGTSGVSSVVSAAGGPDVFGGSSFPASASQIRDVPIVVKWTIRLPKASRQFRALIVAGHRFDNVAIRDPNAVQPAAPTPVATVTRSGSAPAAPVFPGYTITLSNCTPSGQALACSALLTPSR